MLSYTCWSLLFSSFGNWWWSMTFLFSHFRFLFILAKKAGRYIIAALLAAMSIAGPLGLKMIAFIAFKALLISKIALTIAGIIAITKIYSSDHHHETQVQVLAGDHRRNAYVARPSKPKSSSTDPYRYHEKSNSHRYWFPTNSLSIRPSKLLMWPWIIRIDSMLVRLLISIVTTAKFNSHWHETYTQYTHTHVHTKHSKLNRITDLKNQFFFSQLNFNYLWI